jgi:hypothetical protein
MYDFYKKIKMGRDSDRGQSPTIYHFSPLYPQICAGCITIGNSEVYDVYKDIFFIYDKKYKKLGGIL